MQPECTTANFTAAAVAPIAAGAAPHVVIDDAESRVGVGVSNDELVHVRDLTQMRGAVFSSGNYPQLNVTRTSDGVRIERPHAEHLSIDISSALARRRSRSTFRKARASRSRAVRVPTWPALTAA